MKNIMTVCENELACYEILSRYCVNTGIKPEDAQVLKEKLQNAINRRRSDISDPRNRRYAEKINNEIRQLRTVLGTVTEGKPIDANNILKEYLLSQGASHGYLSSLSTSALIADRDGISG